MLDGRITVTTPFDEAFRRGARQLGGEWSRKDRHWTFDADKEAEVHGLARQVFGTGGAETPDPATAGEDHSRAGLARIEEMA